jgi:hypothetical protein
MRVLYSGRRELRKCSQDRKRRCPDCLASDPGRSQQGVQQQQRRINRSIASQFMSNEICMNADTRAHEKQYPISIFLPTLDHLVIFDVRSIIIYGKERCRAVPGIGLSLGWLAQWRLRIVDVVVYYRRHWNKQEQVEDKGNTYRGGSRPRCLGDRFETLMGCCATVDNRQRMRPRATFTGTSRASASTRSKRHDFSLLFSWFACCHDKWHYNILHK